VRCAAQWGWRDSTRLDGLCLKSALRVVCSSLTPRGHTTPQPLLRSSCEYRGRRVNQLQHLDQSHSASVCVGVCRRGVRIAQVFTLGSFRNVQKSTYVHWQLAVVQRSAHGGSVVHPTANIPPDARLRSLLWRSFDSQRSLAEL
jgi:hypothetical protein